MNSVKCGGGRIYSVPMTDIEYIGYFYASLGNEGIQSAYKRLAKIRGREPDFLLNAELFDFNTRQAASDVVSGGVIHRLTEGYGIAFPDNKTAVLSYKNNVNAKDYIGAYPVLVQNGVATKIVPEGIGGARGRTALGIGKNNLYIALVPDGNNDLTLEELRMSFLEVGAEHAINLDGGGSTQFYAHEGNHFTGRNVRGFLGIWLKSSKKEETKKEEGDSMRVLLIAGHGDGDSGAVALGYKEADLARECVQNIKEALSPYCKVDIADTTKNWYKELCKNGKWFDFSSYDYVLEVHFNSAAKDLKGNKKTTGTEIYVTKSEKVVSAEDYILEGMETLGFRNRGVKRKNFDLINFIKKQGVSSALLEVCFLDDKDDVDLYMSNKKAVASVIAEGIANGYQLTGVGLVYDCKLLADMGIINSPDYWAKGSGYSDSNTVALIQKFAKYVRGK